MASRRVRLPMAGEGTPPAWPQDAEGRVTAVRDAEFWERLSRQRVRCDLCYRACVIEEGQAGWCKIRRNDGGRLVLTDHGVVANFQTNVGHSHYWRNHGKMAWVSGVGCTAACSFCTSTRLALAPERMPWAFGEHQPGRSGGWAYHRAMLHPEGVVAQAQAWGCSGVYFGANEPMLTYEFTLDTARLAKAAGLYTRIDTNGFSSPAAIRTLAPYIDMVYLGIKGHADPAFYGKWMRAEGGVPHVLEAAKTWQAGGSFLEISDVLPPAHWVTDGEACDQRRRLYSWIAHELGPLTPLELRLMVRPELEYGDWYQPLIPRGGGDADVVAMVQRLWQAKADAKAAGLLYAYAHDDRFVYCHHCGSVLVGNIGWPSFEKHVHDGRCDHCGGAVPIVVITDQEHAAIQREEHGQQQMDSVTRRLRAVQSEPQTYG